MKVLHRDLGVLLLLMVSPFLGLPAWDIDAAVAAFSLGVAVSGLTLMFGYVGLLPLGNAVFIGIGAYAMGIAMVELGLSTWLSAGLGILLTVVVSAFVAWLLGRVSGFYFAVVTLGLAVAFEGLIRAVPERTGGASGLVVAPPREIFGLDATSALYACAALAAGLAWAVVTAVVRGKSGRILRLVKHDELAAGVLGVDVVRAKQGTIFVGSALAGISGVLLLLWQAVLVPESVGLLRSLELVAMAVVGGLGAPVGGLVGAAAVTWAQDLASGLGELTEIVYGTVLVLVLVAAPRGLLGIRFRWPRRAPTSSDASPVNNQEIDGDSAVGDGEDLPSSLPWSAAGPHEPRRTRADSLTDGLVVRGVSRTFGGVNAVNDVYLTVHPGRITGLIGANGAGKSTLLNLISGVEHVDSGQILLDGVDVTDDGPVQMARHRVARTFQVPRLVDELTAHENVVLGADAWSHTVFRRSVGVEQANAHRADAALAAAGLTDLRDRPVVDLSAGQLRFVELVRALTWQPSVLLMDEPAVGLSVGELDLLVSWLVALRETDTAVMIVDHHLAFLGRIADHVYEMESGAVVREGTPEALLGSSTGTSADVKVDRTEVDPAGHGWVADGA